MNANLSATARAPFVCLSRSRLTPNTYELRFLLFSSPPVPPRGVLWNRAEKKKKHASDSEALGGQVKSSLYSQNAESTRPIKCTRALMALMGMCSSRPKSSWAEEPIMFVSLCCCLCTSTRQSFCPQGICSFDHGVSAFRCNGHISRFQGSSRRLSL